MKKNPHVIADFFNVKAELLQDISFIRKSLIGSAEKSNATILHDFFHKFGGEGGVTGFLALSESHISIHTWPEYNKAHIDIFLCVNNSEAPIDALNHLIESFKPNKHEFEIIYRP